MTLMKLCNPLGLILIAVLACNHSAALAYEKGDMIFRGGATLVAPDEDSGLVNLDGSPLSLSGGNSRVEVDDNTQLGLTFTYVLNNHWGIELLAATPFEHTISGTGELAGIDIADIKHLPPTLSAIYFFNSSGQVTPYMGAGINYTAFFEEDLTGEGDTFLATRGLANGDITLDDSWGLALQVGLDYQINDRWLINASVRWLDIDTDATINFDSGNNLTVDVEIDPWVYTLSVGYLF